MNTAMLLMMCLAVLLSSAAGIPASCRPGTTFKDECNTCTCTSTGLAVCTLKACLSPGTLLRQSRETQECVPGTNFKRGCNECFCTNDGHAACTKSSCE